MPRQRSVLIGASILAWVGIIGVSIVAVLWVPLTWL